MQRIRTYLHTVASREAMEERAVDESGQPAGTSARAGGNGMADRGGVAHADESTWARGGVPESSLEALAASWRQGTAGPGAIRAAAGAARVDATPPEGLLVDPNPAHPPARGRAEVRSPYADPATPMPTAAMPAVPLPAAPQLPPQQMPPSPNGGSVYPQTNGSSHALVEHSGNGFGTGSYPVLPPGYEPMPTYQTPALYHQPPRYEEPRYEEPRYEEPAAYQQPPAYEPPAYHQPLHFAPPQQTPHQAPYQAPQQTQHPHPGQHHDAARQDAPWHEATRPEPQYAPEPPFQPVPAQEPVGALPQRVPGEPDVPDVPDEEVDRAPLAEGPPTETPELARIAAGLRYEKDDTPGAGPERPDGFDMQAVLAAVQGVEGVRDARLRKNPGGIHTLRLELADDADPARVSREVARLLKERMGLAAEPNGHTPNDRALNDRALKRPVAEAGFRSPGQQRAGTSSGPAGAPVSAGLVPHSREARRRHPVPTVRRAEPVRTGEVLRTGEAARETAAPSRPLPGGNGGPRVVLDQVEVKTQGLDAVVEVRLSVDGEPAFGVASGPAVDGYVLRLAAVAAASAIDEMLVDRDGGTRGRCFVEHAAVVPFGSCEVAVVVLLMVCGAWVEQLAGSALVAGDPRQAMVRATLAAVNRRLEALLP
jgi:hypothetical protein